MSLRKVFCGAGIAASMLLASSSALAAVFINEIHYDDSTAAGDLNESIEVVATAGEDLTTYSLVLYNGSGGASYDTDVLPAGTVQSCSGGGSAKFANIIYAVNGVQNGPPDGIALVQGATVIQFLSYEGTFTATNGPASGILSTDIMQSETNSTAPETSLQLSGSGTSYADFTWQPTAAHTRGVCNNGQSFAAPVDNPPTVTLTSPLDLATAVAINSNLVVTFSENVNTDAGAFTLSCPSNAVYPITVSGTGNTRTINPDVDFAFGETCTATVVAANVNDLDSPLDDMAQDYTWTFTTVVDAAPTIASTVPAAGVTGVGVNAVVVINFSEPVSTTIPWISLTCDGDPYTGTLVGSNGDATWTLDPFTNFNNGDVCTVSITGANVVDLDGVANPVAGNPSYSFTVAPDVAPTILSTYPIHLDVNVPAASNLTVVFSEAVTVQAGAFSISCVGSGVHTFVQTDSNQSSYTLNPDDDFTAGEDCTFDITANLISDIDGNADVLAGGNRRIDFTVGAGVAGYYERVDATSCRALRATLHGVIDDHSAVLYSDSGNTWTPGVPSTYDVWEILNLADEDPLDTSKILDIYRNESYTKIEGGNGVYNREHVWPNSQGFNNQQTLDGFPYSPYTDTHMLMASNTTYNSNRGSRVFDTCNPATKPACTVDVTIANASNSAGGGATAYSTPPGHNWYTAGQDGNSGSYEPWSFRRGDLARAMLYMDVRYEGGRNTRNNQREPQLILTDNRSLITISADVTTPSYSGLLTPLLAWHNADAVTEREGLRNAMVESVQGNRNPFVDHPEWADMIFGATCTGPDFVAVDDDFVVTEDVAFTRADIGVLNDDRVFAGASLSVNQTPVSLPAHGAVTLSGNGQFTYTPTADFCGKDSFTYAVSNGSLTDTAVVHLDIVCVNDLPVAVGSISNVSVNVGTALNITTAQAFDDADDDVLVYSVTSTPSLPASLSINAGTGVISGTPTALEAGVYSVVVRASEPSPLTGFITQTFTLTINSDNGAIFQNGFE